MGFNYGLEKRDSRQNGLASEKNTPKPGCLKKTSKKCTTTI